jgi:hypothetical protein
MSAPQREGFESSVAYYRAQKQMMAMENR